MQKLLKLNKLFIGVADKLRGYKAAGQNIEFVFLGSQFLEYILVVAIESVSSTTAEVLFINDPSTLLSPKIKVDDKKDTMGSLVSKLSSLINDELLLQDLRNFVSNDRNRITHHLFGEFDDIGLANTDLTSIVQSGRIEDLMNRVITTATNASMEITRHEAKNPTIYQKLKIEPTDKEREDCKKIIEARYKHP